jgi:hypothetical protein
MPLPYTELKVVPDHDTMLELKIKTPDAKTNGIFLVVSDCWERDRWIEAFLAVGVKIEGDTLPMAHRKPGSWAPSRIRLTSDDEFDRLCSNSKPDGRPLKRETTTQLRAIIEILVDSKDLHYITFILAVALAHAVFAFFYQ